MGKTIKFVSEPESNRLVISIEGVNIDETSVIAKLLTALASNDNETTVKSKESTSLQPHKEETKLEDVEPAFVPIALNFDNKDKAKNYASEHNFKIKWVPQEKTWKCPSDKLDELKEHLGL